jgi:hypothetical protein
MAMKVKFVERNDGGYEAERLIVPLHTNDPRALVPMILPDADRPGFWRPGVELQDEIYNIAEDPKTGDLKLDDKGDVVMEVEFGRMPYRHDPQPSMPRQTAEAAACRLAADLGDREYHKNMDAFERLELEAYEAMDTNPTFRHGAWKLEENGSYRRVVALDDDGFYVAAIQTGEDHGRGEGIEQLSKRRFLNADDAQMHSHIRAVPEEIAGPDVMYEQGRPRPGLKAIKQGIAAADGNLFAYAEKTGISPVNMVRDGLMAKAIKPSDPMVRAVMERDAEPHMNGDRMSGEGLAGFINNARSNLKRSATSWGLDARSEDLSLVALSKHVQDYPHEASAATARIFGKIATDLEKYGLPDNQFKAGAVRHTVEAFYQKLEGSRLDREQQR